LNDTSVKLGGKKVDVSAMQSTSNNPAKTPEITGNDSLLKEQLGFINKMSTDIARVTEELAPPKSSPEGRTWNSQF